MKYNQSGGERGGKGFKILYLVVGLIFMFALVRFAMNLSYFRINSVDIVSVDAGEPLRFVQEKTLFDAVKPHVSGSYFYVDLAQAQNVALQTPWVSDAKIEKIMPNKIRLTIKEHQPVARWIRAGQSAGLVDTDGSVFQANYQGNKLPEFDGDSAALPLMALQYRIFANELNPLRLKIMRLQYSPRASWSIMLENGIEVRLGKQDVNTRLARFVNAWTHSLSEQASALDYVDMRYSDGFATRGGARVPSPTAELDADETAQNKNSN